jgi:hypothetical protein
MTTDTNIYCTREQFAGSLPLDESTSPPSYRHWRYGNCPCGVEHNPARNSQQGTRKSDAYLKELGEPSAIFDYCDEQGQLLFQVLRYPLPGKNQKGKDNKTFKQRRPNGKGWWIWKLDDEATGFTTRRVLYCLPELLASGKQQVFIAEGEKAVDALRLRGLVATCNPHGAKKWEDRYSKWLKDRQVVILPDNDKDGRDHAQMVARALHGIAASVRILPLPDLPEAGDAGEYFAAGGTKEALLQLADQAEEWTPGQDEPEAEPEETRRPLTLRELLARPRPEMLIGGLLRCQRISLIYGDSNSAKTWVADDLGLSVATGQDWHGRKVQQGPVLYVAAEDAQGVAERSQHWLTYHHQDIDIVPFRVWESPIELTSKDDTEAFISAVQASEFAPVLVIIDTFADCFTGDEISNQHMGAAMRNLERIQQALNAHVTTVHHTNKAQTAYRGHSSMRAKMDTILECLLDDETHLLTLRQDKQKGIRKGEDITLKLKVLSLSADPDDTTCVLVTPDQGEIKRQHDSQQMAVLRLIAGYGEQGASAGVIQKAGIELLGKKAAKTVKRIYEALARAGDVLLEDVGGEKQRRYHLTITEQGRAKVGPSPDPEPGNSSDTSSDMTGQGETVSDETQEENHRTDRTNTRESVCPSDELRAETEDALDNFTDDLTPSGKMRALTREDIERHKEKRLFEQAMGDIDAWRDAHDYVNVLTPYGKLEDIREALEARPSAQLIALFDYLRNKSQEGDSDA